MTGDDLGIAGSDVYTIGHGRDHFGALAARCARHGITMIVDVRSEPYSRYAPDFTRSRLEVLCAEAGLAYRWLGASLGGRPGDDPPDYDAMRKNVRYLAGLDEVGGLAASGRITLLCAELEPRHCHRARLIAPDLEHRGYLVHHILSDGTSRPHQPTLALDS